MSSPALLGFVFPNLYLATRPENVGTVALAKLEQGRLEHTVYSAPMPKLKVCLNSKGMYIAMLDTSAEVNVITSDLV